MVVLYKYENFKEVKQNRNYRARLKRKAIQQYRKIEPTVWNVKESDVPRLTIDYLRHKKTHYEEALLYAETQEEYVLLKLMILANIGASFDHLSQDSCKQMMEVIKDHIDGKLNVGKYYTWWERVKRAFRALFGFQKAKAL